MTPAAKTRGVRRRTDLPRFIYIITHREGVGLFSPPGTAIHRLITEFFQSPDAPASMRQPQQVVYRDTPGYAWVLRPADVRAFVPWLVQRDRSSAARVLRVRVMRAYDGYLISRSGPFYAWRRRKPRKPSLHGVAR